MSLETTLNAHMDGTDVLAPAKHSAKLAMKSGSMSVPKLDLSVVAHGERVRLHPNSVRMLLSDEVTLQERERIKGTGSWSRILEPLLTKHVSEALVHDVTKICATVNMIPGQFLLRQGLPAKSIFIVVSGVFRIISLGAPGVEPLDSSRANSARRSFSARQEAQTFGALIDPPKSSRPSASFASEVPVYRVASIGPGQLLGEECFSADRIIQYSVMSESYATVLSIPIDSLLPMLSNERRSALVAMCLSTLAHRAQRGIAGGSWYRSRKIEMQSLKPTDQPMTLVGTAIQNAIKAAKHIDPGTTESNPDHAPFVNSSAPAYPFSTSAEKQQVVQQQLMVCVVSASSNVATSTRHDEGSRNLRKPENVDALHDFEFKSPSSQGHAAENPSASGVAIHSNPSSRPWASHRQHAARCAHNLEIGLYVQPSQSQTGHSVSPGQTFYSILLFIFCLQADMLLSRNLNIKKMYEQLQEAEKIKQIRLNPMQGTFMALALFFVTFDLGDQLSLKNALNMLGRQANVVAKKVQHAPMLADNSHMPLKGSIIHSHLQKLFVTAQPSSMMELASVAKGTPISSCPQSANGRAVQSQESARSRPYNSNFSYLFEAKEAVPPQPEILMKGILSRDHQSSGQTLKNEPQLADQLHLPKSSSNVLKVQAPHPPAANASEHSSSTLNSKRRKYAVISTADFNPFKDADLTVRSLPTRPQSHRAFIHNPALFEKHAAGSGSPRKLISSSVAFSDAKTEPKANQAVLDRSQDPHLFIGSKDAKEGLQQQSKSIPKNSARIKGVHSVVFQIDQVGPSLDQDLEHHENLSFSMSPWKSGA
jgi:CRP-like cAMP-binding protein